MKLLKRLLLTILAPLVLLTGAELILRATGYGYPTSFFVPAEINGRKVLTDNQFFGYRFFSPRIARTPPCIVFDREKQPDTVRVFVLGESAAMGEPLDSFGMARQLACLLKSRYPGKRFEVINSAMTAINSPVIVEIAREAARLQPDAFILYIGNNEVVGPYGPGTVFAPFSDSPRVTRARVLATRLRLVQLLRSGIDVSRGTSGESEEWGGLEMFSRQQVPAADPRLRSVRRQFRANIEEILDIARQAGALSVLCTVAVNLRDCPPFSGQEANAVYKNAGVLETNGHLKESRKSFEVARDLDTLRVRADSVVNETLRELGTTGGNNVRFVDAEKTFGTLSMNGVPGEAYFVDHVHFNFAGNYVLASNIADAVAGLPALRTGPTRGTPSLPECRDRLLYTAWDELDLTDTTIERLRRPPFKDQPGQAARIQALIRHKMGLQDSAQSTDLDEIRPYFLEAMRADPGDWFIPAGWGAILYNRNQYEESGRNLQKALALVPHRYDARAALAMVLGFMGRAGEGVQTILGRDRKGGLFPSQYMARTARLLIESGRPREAAEFLQEAIRQDPDNTRAEQELAACFVKLGQLAEAEATLRDVLKKQPDNTEAAANLAALLSANNRWDEAMTLFSRAMDRKPAQPETRMKYALCFTFTGGVARATLELENLLRDSPDFAEGHFNLGLLYAKRDQWESAAVEFERATKLQPDFANAWFQLARMRQAQGRDVEVREPLMNALRLAPERREFLDEWNRLYSDR